MNDQVYSIQEISEMIKPIAKKHNISRVFIFGSYARDEATKDSDIDLIIDSPSIQTLIQLGSLYLDLEETFHKDFDLIMASSFKYNNDKLFLYNVRKDNRLIYDAS